MTERKIERQHNFRVYEKGNKIINEQTTEIVLNDIQDVEVTLKEVRMNIERSENQKEAIDKALVSMRKEEKALLDFIKDKSKLI